jgi:hypothetical protein
MEDADGEVLSLTEEYPTNDHFKVRFEGRVIPGSPFGTKKMGETHENGGNFNLNSAIGNFNSSFDAFARHSLSSSGSLRRFHSEVVRLAERLRFRSVRRFLEWVNSRLFDL